MQAALLAIILLTTGASAARVQGKGSQASFRAADDQSPGPPKKVHDGLGDELVDQADPTFEDVSQGDDCISPQDFMQFAMTHFPPPPREAFQGMSDAEYEHLIKQGETQLMMMYEIADTKGGEYAGDQCVNKEEFDFAKDMEGPPPKEVVIEHVMEEPMGPTEEEPKKASECGDDAPEAPPGFPSFKQFDFDGNEHVTYEEVQEAAMHEPQPPPQFVVDAFWEVMDSDQDGDAGVDEYCAALKMMTSPGGQEKFGKIVEKHMMESEQESHEAECAHIDDNKDNKIGLNEAIDFVAALEGTDMTVEKVQKIFEAADTDNDGFLTYDECAEAGKHYEGDGKHLLLFSKNRTMLRNASSSSAQKLASVNVTQKNVSGKMQTPKLQKSFWQSLWINQRVLSQWHPESAWLTQTRKSPIHSPSMHKFLYHLRVRDMREKKVETKLAKKA